MISVLKISIIQNLIFQVFKVFQVSKFTVSNMLLQRQLRVSILSAVRQFSSTSKSYQKPSLTFFTKETCMLCTNARGILFKTLEHESLKEEKIDLKIVDIMKPENKEWFDVYCYDVPVLHVDRTNQTKPIKFMHYFYEDKLLEEFNKE